MGTKDTNDLRIALKAVLDAGPSKSATANQARNDAHTVYANSFPAAVEDAVMDAARRRGPYRVSDFQDALHAHGTNLLEEVLSAQPELLDSESSRPEGTVLQRKVEALERAFIAQEQVAFTYRDALARIAAASSEDEPPEESYEEAAYGSGMGAVVRSQAAIARGALAKVRTEAVDLVELQSQRDALANERRTGAPRG